ncbi:metallophosphoesterase [Salinarchaeum sp. Harcht-Bsk1]|uniref:DNA double-strand break repair protein Mre11 n=1 Tax=Salinarchaeum sp. Harcht-Bsk1 TaxID=1333523 RepID=UPI000342450F|nr:DNA double-strand break repair protein Mre11 [Salinarchaeum sp. Harcht-Bsk1]AGN00396.1 metallophosphoesterase [Salinarchaeum sp. Harcht-Bsk1]
MTRVLHTGDTHVGYQQYHDPRRRRDFLRGFESVVEDAIADDVDAVVHAGDLFHDRRPDLQDLQGVVAALRELRAAGIPFLAIVGNHEAKRSGQWLDLFADLDLAERLDDEPRVVGEEGDDLALYGLDHVPESERDELGYEFDGHDAARSALVAHGLFGPFDPAEWDTEHVLDAATVDFDAMLLGDNHIPGKQQVGDTWVTYPGSTERASASERADRGYNVVTVDDGGLRITRRTLETREFVFVDVELADGEGAEVVRERVREHDHEDAVTIVTVEGEGEPIAPGPIEELASEQGAIVARVNDRRDVETAEDDDLEVSFADPDEAVRQRVREMGLSSAARDLDRVVRDGSIADSNVRGSARRRVAEHREAGLEAFEPVPEEDRPTSPVAEDGDESGSESVDDGAASESDTAPSAADTATQDVDSGRSSADPGTSTADPDMLADDPDTTDGPSTSSDDAGTTDDPGASPDGTSESSDDAPAEKESQASMEEYL